VTNGSYRPMSWWQQLGQVLDEHDEIHWSIDGWDQVSNEQYRVHSDWDSIMSGISAFTQTNQSTYRVWAAIAFRFNQDRLDHMRGLASNVGMDLFQITKSTKFGSHYPETYGHQDPLCPDRSDLISSGQRFERMLTDLTRKPRPAQTLKYVFWARAQDLDRQKKHAGICLIGNKGVFLNSRGEFYPCCWTANRYQHNEQWHALAKDRFNLWHHTFESILQDDFWTGPFLQFDSQECRTKCTPEKLKDLEHTTEW
jgi:hypothetical protein